MASKVPGLSGVYSVVVTPFMEDGSLDLQSLERLTSRLVDVGVQGLTILGVAGEANKLREAEKDAVVKTVMRAVDGSVEVCMGTSDDGTSNTIEASRRAQDAGANAVMVAPPTFLASIESLLEHYGRIGDSIDIPIVLQDYPPSSGVTLTPEQLARICVEVPSVTTVKLEDPPTSLRMSQLLSRVPDGVSTLGGLGGMYLHEELRRGSSGVMTGFGYPEVLVEIVEAWTKGECERAEMAYYRYLPLIMFEGQPKIGLAIRKEILRRRGWIRSGQLRQPAMQLPESLKTDLDAVLSMVEHPKLETAFSNLTGLKL